MTDIVEQAARVLSTQTTCDGEPHPTEVHRRQAQALADAGLLAQPARTVPTRDVYELATERIGTGETWTADAREVLDLPRTVPTRGEIATAIMQADRAPHTDYTPQADAVLALMNGQPTVAEAKAQALEEFAEVWATGEWSDWFLAENVTCDVSAVQATDKALRERAQEIREDQ